MLAKLLQQLLAVGCFLLVIFVGKALLAPLTLENSEEVGLTPRLSETHSNNPEAKLVALKEFAARKESLRDEKRQALIDKAREAGIPMRNAAGQKQQFELQGFVGNRPVYYGLSNQAAAQTIEAHKVWSGGGLGLSLDGSGQIVGLWDKGLVRSSHQEFNGRVTQMDFAVTADHATHTAGTLIASGVSPQARGMARNSTLRSYDWNSDALEMANSQLVSSPIKVSNHSYNVITGWFFDLFNDGRWIWAGDVSVSVQEDFMFGFYDEQAREWDQVAYNAPAYLIVTSAGNDRNDNGPSGATTHWEYNGNFGSYQLSSSAKPVDGGASGFDTIAGGSANSKNVMTVGAVQDIFGGYQSPNSVQDTGFSAWGPTDDGRIKPDIVASGWTLYSSNAQTTASYDIRSGTSMAAPGVSGAVALLAQHADNLFGVDLLAATLKALTIHTAQEAGAAPGPDYKNGWGLLNTAAAAQLLTEDADRTSSSNWYERNISTGMVDAIEVVSNGQDPLKVTIAWTDPAGTPAAVSLDPTQLMLVNDLDVRIISPTGQVFNPWILNPGNPNAAALTGDNFRDNVEQVLIDAPVAGVYKIQVSHKGSLLNGGQAYSLIVSGNEDQLPPVSLPQIVSTPSLNAWAGSAYLYDANMAIEASGTPTVTYQLIDGPFGLEVTSTGTVSWIPSIAQLGSHPVEIQASNVYGADTQSFTVTVFSDPPIDFNSLNVSSYTSQDTVGNVAIENGGSSLRLNGDLWKQINFPYTVTSNTVLEFDFHSNVLGELHGIGLDDDLQLSEERTFQLYGSQTWGNQQYRNYPGGGVTRHYQIRVGDFFTGPMQHLFFMMDDDAAASGESAFSNIRIYELPVPPQITSVASTQAVVGQPYAYDSDGRIEVTGSNPVTMTLVEGPDGMTVNQSTGQVNWTPVTSGSFDVEISATNIGGTATQEFTIIVLDGLPEGTLDFNALVTSPYTSQDTSGSVVIQGIGEGIQLVGNVWKKVDFVYTVTPDTVLEFDFSSSVMGELHGIGLDNDLVLSSDRTFQLYGSQSWGLQDHRDYPGGGVTRHYKIRVGDFFTGQMLYLFFMMDDDAAVAGESVFSNIRLYEDVEVPPPSIPQITSTPSTQAVVDVAYLYDADGTIDATGTGSITFALVTGPANMMVNGVTGAVTWTPSTSGSFDVEISAANTAGTATQEFTIIVFDGIPEGTLDFNALATSPYTSQDTSGSVVIQGIGEGIQLVGNVWKKVDFAYTVTPDTVLEFDFRSSVMGELHGIGLDDDLVLSPDRTFQLYGSQNWGLQNHRDYPGGGVTTHYKIRVGDFFTGPMLYLFFMMDDDAALAGESVFSNIRIYEDIFVPPPVAPQITSSPSLVGVAGQAYIYDSDGRVDITGTAPITFALVEKPSGMTINATNGQVTWTPGSAGFFDVTIQATNAAGNTTQQFSVTVSPAPSNEPLDFNDFEINTYLFDQDITGDVSIEGGGTSLRLQGNLWKMINFPYTVTEDTILEFDFSSNIMGELHGIGMDNDQTVSAERTFQLYGSQTWGVQDYRNYPGGGVTTHYKIRLGNYFTGPMLYLFFMMDHDLAPSGESLFSNVRVYEEPPPANALNFNQFPPTTYLPAQDIAGTVSIENDGFALRLTGNLWKKVDFPYTVTANTVLEFDFRSDVLGELHGIGTDDDLVISGDRTYQLYGTQTWGNQDFRDYTPGVTRRYTIRLGDYITGEMQYLFFFIDDDEAQLGESLFRNITITEQAQ